MAEKKATAQQTPEQETKEEKPSFDYKNKASFKVSDKFKAKFNTRTAGGETMSADGLVALAHVKGMWKLESKIIQFPNQENGNMCICQATVGGYDWDPIEEKLIRVEYTEIGDASPQNCNRMVGPSFIRMASTRAISRALRRYTNIDMLCTEELSDEDISTTSMLEMAAETRITMDMLNQIKGLVMQKHIDQELFNKILKDTLQVPDNFGDFQSLTVAQGQTLLTVLQNYIPPQPQQPAQQQQ